MAYSSTWYVMCKDRVAPSFLRSDRFGALLQGALIGIPGTWDLSILLKTGPKVERDKARWLEWLQDGGFCIQCLRLGL